MAWPFRYVCPNMRAPDSAPQIFNEIRFQRMSCGDLDSFHELADEYFIDVRTRMRQWPGMRQAREWRRLGEEFHRCKGGAAMFGFERIFALVGSWEVDSRIERGDVDLEQFAEELEAADRAVAEYRSKESDGRENSIA